MKKLSNSVIEKIQYYVYILIDPRDWNIFYIWKWKWNRVFSHLNWTIKWEKPSDKINKIKDIIDNWLEIKHYIVRHWLTEKESFEVEWALIDFYWKSNLTNQVLWHKSNERWIMDIDEINIKYYAWIAKIDDEVILININNMYELWISKEDLYQATRKYWKVDKNKASKAKYALSHYHWIIRWVYKIDEWYSSKVQIWRSEFNWKLANDDIQKKYLHKSIAKYFKKWSQNPIKYVNI